jgi:hypothetical protein
MSTGNQDYAGTVISAEFIAAQRRYLRGRTKVEQMANEIEHWLWLKDNGASQDIMNRLLELHLQKFRERDHRYFRRIADALQYKKKKGDDTKFYIFAAHRNLCLQGNPTYSARITADLLIQEAKQLWASDLARRRSWTLERARQEINNRNIRWYRQLAACGLGGKTGVKPRKSGRKLVSKK